MHCHLLLLSVTRIRIPKRLYPSHEASVSISLYQRPISFLLNTITIHSLIHLLLLSTLRFNFDQEYYNMQLSIISTSLAFAFAHAQGSIEGWEPAGPTDRRPSNIDPHLSIY
jgi:hypothetical protein